jgi:NAD(P)-dependent dehydrogenase (short-subunit alcohol dehydrogenase family)
MVDTTQDLSGLVMFITGAGRGIGKGIAEVAAHAGADVAINALTNRYVDDLSSSLARETGRRVVPIVGDVISPAGSARAVSEVLDAFGHIDILVNGVGDSIRKPFVDPPDAPGTGMSDEDVQTVMDLNITATMATTRAIAPHFLARRSGNVINISSASINRRGANAVVYATAKAGVVAFTRALALEWAPYNIRVNAVAPGTFPDAVNFGGQIEEVRQDIAARTPLGRAGELQEVGQLVRYLASSASDYMTGQTIFLDGGASL